MLRDLLAEMEKGPDHQQKKAILQQITDDVGPINDDMKEANRRIKAAAKGRDETASQVVENDS